MLTYFVPQTEDTEINQETLALEGTPGYNERKAGA